MCWWVDGCLVEWLVYSHHDQDDGPIPTTYTRHTHRASTPTTTPPAPRSPARPRSRSVIIRIYNNKSHRGTSNPTPDPSHTHTHLTQPPKQIGPPPLQLLPHGPRRLHPRRGRARAGAPPHQRSTPPARAVPGPVRFDCVVCILCVTCRDRCDIERPTSSDQPNSTHHHHHQQQGLRRPQRRLF